MLYLKARSAWWFKGKNAEYHAARTAKLHKKGEFRNWNQRGGFVRLLMPTALPKEWSCCSLGDGRFVEISIYKTDGGYVIQNCRWLWAHINWTVYLYFITGCARALIGRSLGIATVQRSRRCNRILKLPAFISAVKWVEPFWNIWRNAYCWHCGGLYGQLVLAVTIGFLSVLKLMVAAEYAAKCFFAVNLWFNMYFNFIIGKLHHSARQGFISCDFLATGRHVLLR